MADFFTDDELAAMAAREQMTGHKRVPDEHRARYAVLAIEQMSMVQTTLTRVALQAMRDKPLLDNATLGGCMAGMRRAMLYVAGYTSGEEATDNALKPDELVDEISAPLALQGNLAQNPEFKPIDLSEIDRLAKLS